MATDHASYDKLKAQFLEFLEGALKEDGDQIGIALSRSAAKDFAAMLRHAGQTPYLTPDVVMVCKGMSDALGAAKKLSQDFPVRVDPASLVGRTIAVAAQIVGHAHDATLIAADRHVALEHVARNWWTAVAQALDENASYHAIRAARALANMQQDDQLEIRERVAQLLCLSGLTQGDDNRNAQLQ